MLLMVPYIALKITEILKHSYVFLSMHSFFVVLHNTGIKVFKKLFRKVSAYLMTHFIKSIPP